MSGAKWILIVVLVSAASFLAGLFYGRAGEMQLGSSFNTSESVALLAKDGSTLVELPPGLVVHSLHDPLAKESTRYALIFQLHASSKSVKQIDASEKRKSYWRSYPAAAVED